MKDERIVSVTSTKYLIILVRSDNPKMEPNGAK